VYGGEHYVVDCIAGWIYAGATYFAVEYAFAWRTRRREALAPILAD
jgi:hypothetical protein